MTSLNLSVLATVAGVLLASTSASAALCDGSRAESDSNLQDRMGPLPSTINDFYPWHLNTYFIAKDAKWQGVNNPGGLSDEYGKHLLSAYLVEHGVDDHVTTSYYDHDGRQIIHLDPQPSFYTSAHDWGPNTRAKPPATNCRTVTYKQTHRICDSWHDTYVSVVDYYAHGYNALNPGPAAQWIGPSVTEAWEWIQHNVLNVPNYEFVATYCDLYNEWNEGVYRAAGLVHEAWHSNEWHQGPPSHGEPSGYCQDYGDSEACDTFYPPQGTGVAGGLRTAHMGAYQADLMFACDLSDASQPWVPLETQLLAEATYYRHESGTFSNVPIVPFACGMPTPLRGLKPGADRCPAGTPVATGYSGDGSLLVCDSDDDCLNFETCTPGRCCDILIDPK